jgi:hypothetical protein
MGPDSEGRELASLLSTRRCTGIVGVAGDTGAVPSVTLVLSVSAKVVTMRGGRPTDADFAPRSSEEYARALGVSKTGDIQLSFVPPSNSGAVSSVATGASSVSS